MKIIDVLKNLTLIFSYLSLKRKRQVYSVVFLMAISSFLEVFSISMVIPFITVLLDPTKLESINKYFDFENLINFFGFDNDRLFLTLLFILAFLSSNLFKIFIVYLFNRISRSIAADLNLRMFKHLLFNKYHQTIKENSSYRMSAMTEKVHYIINLFFNFFTFFSGLIILFFTLTLFLFFEPLLTSFIFVVLILIFLVISKFLNKSLLNLSKIIAKKISKKLVLIRETFGGLRQIILDKTQNTYLAIFESEETSLRKSEAISNFFQMIPKYIVEIFGITIIVLFSYYLMNENIFNTVELITLLGFIGFAAIRLLPITTNMYQSYNYLLSTAEIVNEFANYLMSQKITLFKNHNQEPIKFKKNIQFKNIGFSYEEDSHFTVKNINFEIEKNDKIGIIGETGSGKSTIIDLLIGLLEPKNGNVMVDGNVLQERNISNWQEKISHVPQDIYLMDRTISENIAFTIEKNEINQSVLNESIKLAGLDEFIHNLKDKENTLIGERGIFLSGGQKQRIGLARAFYNQKEILILDEATSALDIETEKKIIKNLNNKYENLTIIQISHRIQTLKLTNKIFKIEKDGTLKITKYENEIKQLDD